ncbi:hypothetical protein BJF78_08565 [Pseudonocardia sp. CNS-139]|nr:hypothetical protein BJF78_08565 [Pseudonocardia sp. CNS-139]
MSTQTPSPPAAGQQERRGTGWAGGLTVFAAAIMVVGGLWQVLAGIAALFQNVVYVTTPSYVYSFDLTAWGWVHLILGILIVVAGFAVISGQTWARAVGIGLACLSLLAQFLFLPYYPIWSLVIMALDVAVIWALATYRRDAL